MSQAKATRDGYAIERGQFTHIPGSRGPVNQTNQAILSFVRSFLCSELSLVLRMYVCYYAPILYGSHRNNETSQTLVSEGSSESMASGHRIAFFAEESLHSKAMPAL
jgi:hypothetical protein